MHWPFSDVGRLSPPDRAPGLRHLSTLQRRWRDGRAPGAPVSSSWPGQKRHLAGRIHGSTTPLGVSGADWGGDPPPPEREWEREREYRDHQTPTHIWTTQKDQRIHVGPTDTICRSHLSPLYNTFSISPFPRCIIIMSLNKHKYLFYATWWVSFGCCCHYFYRSLWLKIHYYRTDKWPNNVVTRRTEQ